MITINNIEKILAINSQKVEVMHFQEYKHFYEFEFIHDNIDSTTFKVHMNRNPDSSGDDSFTLKLWDGISNSHLEYYFERKDVKDPFTLLNYLKEVLYDWDNVTNK
jgi:hypothetical protein